MSTPTRPTTWSTAGYPSAQLPAAAELPQTLYGSPDYQPLLNGAAINEADYSTYANVASQQTGLTGQGVTVGILSDSFNNLGGYATDVKTGDLPPNVDILQEGPTTGEDEGRGMAQNIYHIAPGAGLAFATGFGTTQQFATNVKALANTAGAKVIVDDVRTLDDPYFQPGLISQAINTVTAQGVSYFSSADNEANHGYLSNFRGAAGTVTGLGTGRSRISTAPAARACFCPSPSTSPARQTPRSSASSLTSPRHPRKPLGGLAQPRRSTSISWTAAATSSPREPPTTLPAALRSRSSK